MTLSRIVIVFFYVDDSWIESHDNKMRILLKQFLYLVTTTYDSGWGRLKL